MIKFYFKEPSYTKEIEKIKNLLPYGFEFIIDEEYLLGIYKPIYNINSMNDNYLIESGIETKEKMEKILFE